MARVNDLPGALTALTEKGVLATPMAGRLRFVAHRDATPDDIAEVLKRLTVAR